MARRVNIEIERKRYAVVARLREAMPALDTLSDMWEEHTLDALLIAFGIGHVVLDNPES